jgi:probable rRNA maturation factor
MVRITIRNLQKKVFVHPQKIKAIINRVLKKEKVKGKHEINICFISDIRMRRLNKKYLNKDSPTDVLAFDIANPKKRGGLYADILVSTDTASRNAKIFKTTPSYELSLYSIHGLLHLLGYDDHSLKNQKLMRKKESKYVHT